MKNILLTLGIILLLLGSFIFLFNWGLSHGFNNKGQIGDTIGGITAPVINIIGSILIYVSFVAQNKANKILSDQNSFSAFHEMYKDVKSDFSNLIFSSSSYADGKEYFGKKALSNFTIVLNSRIDNKDFCSNSFFEELEFVVGNILIVADVIDESTLNEKEKQYLINILSFFYLTKIDKHLTEILEVTKDKKIHENFRLVVNSAYESFKLITEKHKR